MSGLVVGVDLGGTNMQAGVVDEAGAVVAQLKRKTRAAKGPDAVFDRLIESVQRVCAQAGVAPGDLDGAGLAVAAAVDADRGVVLEAPNLGWRDLPLAQRARERL
ncbi:MAG: ROK family protein, partial [Planctomycetota bacterium]